MYSPCPHDHIHRPQRPAAFSEGSVDGDNSPLKFPCRQRQDASTLYQDIVVPGRQPKSQIPSLSLHNQSYPPMTPTTRLYGSLQFNGSALDWFPRHPRQSVASHMNPAIPRQGNKSQSSAHPTSDIDLSYSYMSQEPGTDTLNNGSLIGDNAHLDRPLHEPQQIHALQSSLPLGNSFRGISLFTKVTNTNNNRTTSLRPTNLFIIQISPINSIRSWTLSPKGICYRFVTRSFKISSSTICLCWGATPDLLRLTHLATCETCQ